MDKLERTPLMLAAWEGHDLCVDSLLVNNADTEVTLDVREYLDIILLLFIIILKLYIYIYVF